MKHAILIVLAVLIAGPAWPKELILCQSAGKPDVTITLQDRRAFDKTLDCISGSFIADMTPCAPPGEYGLSAPTGSADLVGVVNRWQDYAQHTGGVTGHFITADKIFFSGGLTDPETGYKEQWSFMVNRLTGAAQLKEKNKPEASYSCSKAKPRF